MAAEPGRGGDAPGGGSAPPGRLRRLAATGLGQWPAVAGAWSVYGAVLLTTSLSILAATRILLGQKLAVVLFVLFLLVAEIGLLVLANGLLEMVTGAIAARLWLDALRGLGLGLGVGLLVASLTKFRATGVHLKTSDLAFALRSLRQIVQESLPAEARALLITVGVLVVVAILASLALVLLRRRPADTRPAQIALLTALALIGSGYTWFAYPVVRRFATYVLPESYLLRAAPGPRAGRSSPALSSAALAALAGPPIEPWSPPAEFRRHNVVLIMLESVPWTRIAGSGGRPGVTPNLERLMAESIVFSRPYTTSTHSDYAQMAILSSLHPRKFDRHDFYLAIDYPRTLVWDVLRRAGYRTAMFSCQNERWGNMITFLNTPGLELLRHSLDWPGVPHKGRGSESKVFEQTPVSEWKRWRDSGPGEPYFTYLNFQASHFPYEIPADAPTPFEPFQIDFPASFFRYPRDKTPVMLNRFFNSLSYADRWVGEVETFLKLRAEWERTALIVVSDHGEAFYEHDEPTHGSSLYEEQVLSLLMMRLPGVEPRLIEEPVSLLDVVPALLDYLELPPHPNFQGRGDILAPDYIGRHRPLFFTIQGITFEDAVLADGWKYIINWDRRYRRLFNLTEDPGETRDLLLEKQRRAEVLDRLLASFLARQLGYYEHRLWERGAYVPALP